MEQFRRQKFMSEVIRVLKKPDITEATRLDEVRESMDSLDRADLMSAADSIFNVDWMDELERGESEPFSRFVDFKTLLDFLEEKAAS